MVTFMDFFVHLEKRTLGNWCLSCNGLHVSLLFGLTFVGCHDIRSAKTFVCYSNVYTVVHLHLRMICLLGPWHGESRCGTHSDGGYGDMPWKFVT
jgi:hypothetical protein